MMYMSRLFCVNHTKFTNTERKNRKVVWGFKPRAPRVSLSSTPASEEGNIHKEDAACHQEMLSTMHKQQIPFNETHDQDLDSSSCNCQVREAGNAETKIFCLTKHTIRFYAYGRTYEICRKGPTADPCQHVPPTGGRSNQTQRCYPLRTHCCKFASHHTCRAPQAWGLSRFLQERERE